MTAINYWTIPWQHKPSEEQFQKDRDICIACPFDFSVKPSQIWIISPIMYLATTKLLITYLATTNLPWASWHGPPLCRT